MRLKDKVAIVTGSGRGIGEGIALRFAEEGAKVVVNDVNEAEVKRTVEAIKSKGGQAVGVVGSVTSREVAQKMVDTAVKEFGTVDILINNAGITRDAMLHKMTDEQWDQVIDVNLKGVFPLHPVRRPGHARKGVREDRQYLLHKLAGKSGTAQLFGHQSRRDRHDQDRRQGAGPQRDQCQRDRSGHDLDGHDQSHAPGHRRANGKEPGLHRSLEPQGSAAGYRQLGPFPGLRRELVHHRPVDSLRRGDDHVVTKGSRTQGAEGPSQIPNPENGRSKNGRPVFS